LRDAAGAGADISIFASESGLPEFLNRAHYHEARTTGMSANCVSIL
jgi:hypothetical protein